MKNITRFVFLFVLLNAVVYVTAQAQIIINNGGRIQIVNNNGVVQNSGGPENNLIQAPRETIQRLKTAIALMENKRYSESVRILWDILKTEEDAFIRVNVDKSVVEEAPESSEENDDPNSSAPQAEKTPPPAGPTTLISLKTYIQNILAQAPEEARRASELIVGTEAQNALNAALESGSLDRLLKVSRDYFHTEAGYKASFLAGLILLNEGQATTAASLFDSLDNTPGVRQKFEPAFSVLWLNSLILSGQDVERRELVTQLRHRLARVDWTVENKSITGFDNLEQLEKYLAVFSQKGQKKECSYSSAEPFALPRWTVSTAVNPALERLVQTFIDNELKSMSADSYSYNALMSTFQPAVSGQRVFFRTLFGLSAVDLQTGKRLWDSSSDFSSLIQKQWDNNGEFERKAIFQFLYSAIIFRSKYDFTYGTLKADDKYVYAIEDIWKDRVQQGVLSPRSSTGITIARSGSGSFAQNRLAAYDIITGKLKWHVGSATINYGFSADNSLDSTSFLGAPLVLDGKLYILGETSDSSVVFYELDSATGKVLWSQTLGESQNSLSDRTFNLTPIYQNGILVCPISGSSLVCIDLHQRRLLWGFNSPLSQKRYSGMGFITSDFRYELSSMNSSYNNSSFLKGYQLSIINNKAFYTPVRSSETFVINISDGSLDENLSSLRTQKYYFPLSYSQKEFIVMTQTDIRICDIEKFCQNQKEYDKILAQRNEKMQQVAKAPSEERQKILEEYSRLTNEFSKLEEQRNSAITIIPFPDSSRLVGRAFEFDGMLYIPLNNNTLAEFDFSKREFVKSLKVPDNMSFGSVSLLSDKVFSQKYDRLDCFDVKQFVDSLLQNKDNDSVRALLASGYMAWENDDIETAAKKFRLAVDKAPQSCFPLMKALAIYALKKDYSRYESLLDTFQPAFDNEQGRMIIAQFKIKSSLLNNNIQECLTTLESVMDDAVNSELQACTIDLLYENLLIERNVWIGSILEKVYMTASEEQKRFVEQWAAKRLDVPNEQRRTKWLERQLDFFRALPIAAQLRKELYQQYVSSNSLVKAELLLRQQRQESASSPEIIAASWAEQALLIQKYAPEDSAKIFKLINRLYPEIPCCQDKTADAYVKSLGDSSPVYKAYSYNPQWPGNELHFAVNKVERQTIQSGSDHKKQFVNENLFLDGSIVNRSSNQQQNLILRDKYGRITKRLSPDRTAQPGRIISYRADMYAAEHLFFMSEKSGQISAINFLANPQLLWLKDYEQDKLGDEDKDPYILIQKANHVEVRVPDSNKYCGIYGNVVLAQMEDGSFIGVDAADGRMRWQRKLENNEAIVFVDDEFFYTTKNRPLDKEGNVYGSFSEVAGERYSIYSGVHDSSIRLPNSRMFATLNGIICLDSVYNSSTQKQSCFLRLCSIKDQKVLWTLESDFNFPPVYINGLNILYRSNVSNGQVQIVDVQTGKIILDDIFEVMTQEERDKIVKRVAEQKKQIEEEKKKIEEEEKNDPKKREERIRRQSREGRPEDVLPENFSENAAKNFFDGIDIVMDGSANGDFYLIVRSSFGYTRKQRNSIKQFSPMRAVHLPKAKVYKFSKDGKSLWKEPLQVNDQYFYFDQPSASPFIIMGCMRQRLENNSPRWDYSFQFVDKNTGRVWSYQGKNSIGCFQQICDPEQKKVEITISSTETLVLKYTDTPIPQDAPMAIQLYTDEEKKQMKKEKETLEKEMEAAGEDDPFDD